jgi:hypothetical protein
MKNIPYFIEDLVKKTKKILIQNFDRKEFRKERYVKVYDATLKNDQRGINY